ncbi:hypothetical protein F5B22DRAFT_643765 [Xylaria bambusicola]|uniref:uncharacterized protein n=1 Tax=Xylaria bambusicola TaxID=326684 RepID=UPI002008DD60|nr:uncharacterized protein F5B22DRAFT_643765 [Xylaria bambusicola]KAI0521596.1 hypothetical protein F5B22DRAFT_643765 [Xylaria bambusicola]
MPDMTSPAKSPKEYEDEVRSWGFTDVYTWTDAPNAYYRPHSHNGLATHLIIRGSLTITYPKDETPTKETFSAGARVDVDPRRVHEVWIGPSGCTMVIGERED